MCLVHFTLSLVVPVESCIAPYTANAVVCYDGPPLHTCCMYAK